MKSSFLVLLLGSIATAIAGAAELAPRIEIRPPSREFFKGEQFARQFAGTYKFISDTEPKVEQDEKDILLELQEMFEKGQTRQAETRLRGFMDLRKSEGREVSPALVFTLATMYFQAGKLDKGEELYKIAIQRHPDFRRAHKNLAFLYLSDGKFEKAFPSLQRAIQLGDADHRSFGMLGYIYLKREDYLAAENAYRQAILLNPTEKDWKVGLAQTLMSMENYSAAAALLTTMIERSPQEVAFQALLANAYLGQGETLKAAEVFEALRLRGRITPQQLEMVGNIYMDKGLNTLAVGSYLEALAKEEKVVASRHLKIGRILADYGDARGAAQYLDEVEKKAGGSLSPGEQADMLFIRVKIAENEGDIQEVKHLLRQVLKLQPTNGKAMCDLAKVIDNEARTETDEDKANQLTAEAKAQLKSALALDEPETNYLANLRLGQLHVARQKFIEAVDYLDRAIDIRSKDKGPGAVMGLKNYRRSVNLRAEIERRKQKAQEERRERRRAALDKMKPAEKN